MQKIFSVKHLLLSLSALILFCGCAHPPLPDLYWPSPPDQPRIKYVREYRSGQDFDQTSSTAADILLGREGGLAIKKPMSVFVDNSGVMFVSDTAASDVLIFDPAKKSVSALNAISGKSALYKPIGIAVDYIGRVFVADSQSSKVYVYDRNYQFMSQLSTPVPFDYPSGVAVDNERRLLYITNTHSHDIRVFDLNTLKYKRIIGKRGKAEGEFNFPSHLATDAKGNLYVVDTMNGRIQIFDSEGTLIRAFGQFGDAAGMFARPKGIGVDSEGHIYVADAAFNVVQIFDQEGQILLAFSGYGPERGNIVLASGLYVDKDDFIYVVDSWNRRIEVYEYLGEKSKAREAAKAAQPEKGKGSKK